MALVKCPECRKEVSDTANACPNCGYGVKVYFDKIKKIEQDKKNRQDRLNSIVMPQKPQKKKLSFGEWTFILIWAILGVLAFSFAVGDMGGDAIAYLIIGGFISSLLYYAIVLQDYNKEKERYNRASQNFEKYKEDEIMAQDLKRIRLTQGNYIHCPKCGSTNIQMVPRKWSPLTGFMTNKVDRVCVNCKNRF